MPDVVDVATRSRMMAGIKGKNTKPELQLRKALHRRGFRFRIHSSKVPGKPDLVLPAFGAAIFVNGCFWHGHDCKFFRLPASRTEFWRKKITRNRKRDRVVRDLIKANGWRRLVVWECALRGRGSGAPDHVGQKVAQWLRSKRREGEIRGD